METSNNELQFLDIVIKRDIDKIWMDIYFTLMSPILVQPSKPL